MKAKRKSGTPGNASAKRLLSKDAERSWHYSGTREELIAAGLARDGDFPGDPGAPICSHTIERDDRHSHIRIHSRVVNPNTFWVVVSKTPVSVAKAEAKRQRDEENVERRTWPAKRREAALAQAEEVGSRIATQLAKLPSSPGEYRERVVHALRVAVSHIYTALCGKGYVLGDISVTLRETGDGSDKFVMHGYRVDSRALREFNEAVEDVVAVLRSARVISDAKSRADFVLNVRAGEAKDDREFSSFMRGIVPTESSAQPD
jgi:hypothetical protein